MTFEEWWKEVKGISIFPGEDMVKLTWEAGRTIGRAEMEDKKNREIEGLLKDFERELEKAYYAGHADGYKERMSEEIG